MLEIEPRDRELLDAIQSDVPLISTPWAGVGQVIDMSEKEVLKRLERLRRNGLVATVRGVFDARALGYTSSLVAASVPEQHLERVASTVNLHPGVTKNYQRNHRFNLWFSILLPPDGSLGLEETVSILTAGADHVLLLPAITSFRADGSEDAATSPARQLTPRELEAVRLLQNDLPPVPRPFEELARDAELSGDELLEVALQLRSEGRLRGLAAAVQPRGRAFSAQALVVWATAADRVRELAQTLASRPEIGRSWIRPTQPGWPYSVFTILHGRSVDEYQALVFSLADELAIEEYALLFPVREYKKSRITYFAADVAGWEASQAGIAGSAG